VAVSHRRLFRSLLAASAISALALAVPGGAAQADPLGIVAGETLDVSAQKLDVDVDKGRAVLEGNVHATLGDLTVECPKVEIKYDRAPRVRWAKGTGGVTARVKGIEAKASVVEVDVAERRVKLSGGVRLARGRGWLKAGRATIDLDTRKVSLEDVAGSIPVETPAR
jgi:lipopolysaccharide export system protein LptA